MNINIGTSDTNMLSSMTAGSHDCKHFSEKSRDDGDQAGRTLFYVLFTIYLVCQVCALTVTIAMLTNRKTKSKV